MCTDIRARSAKGRFKLSLPPEGQRQKDALDFYPAIVPFTCHVGRPRAGSGPAESSAHFSVHL